jgi:outer membrane protein OmpA-like peptidoglycan-associated protein
MRIALFILATAMSLTAPILTAQQPSLLGEYYNGTNFQTKVTSRMDREINFNWENRRPAAGMDVSYFSIRWTGKLLAPASGKYTFSARVDDGIRVWVGGQKVIDAWALHDEGRFSGTIDLKANQYYDLKVEYFNDMFEGEIQLRWEVPGASGGAKAIEAKYYAPSSAGAKPAVAAVKNKTPQKKIRKPAVPVKKNQPKPGSEKQKPVSVPPAGTTPPPEFAKKQRELELKHIYFVQSKDEILPSSKTTLDDWATFLKQRPEAVIYVKGHTDELGDAAKNQELSEKRAQLVADYMVGKGIGKDRIFTKGYGSTKPYFVNPATERDRALNRRVEISVK